MEVNFLSASEHFFESLEHDTIGKAWRIIKLLQRFGNELKMPYSKPLVQGLFEIRIHGRREVRFIYTFHNDCAVVLHGFIKKTQRTPPQELEIALARKRALDTV